MKLCGPLAQVPLEGGQLALKMEINSIFCERELRSDRQPILIAVVGCGDGELVAWMLRLLLEGMPHTRVGAITLNGVWLAGEEWPVDSMDVPQLLRRMAEEDCTHVVLQLDEDGLVRGAYADLRMSVTALTGPIEHRQQLARLLENSDTVVLNLDEPIREDYGSIIPVHTFTYSENKSCADLVARNLRLYPGHMEFEAVGLGHIQRIHLPVPGGFTLYHGLCALACGECLGLQRERMGRILRCIRGPRQRLEVLDVSAAYTVVQDRADTPRELERLLVAVREFAAGQLICVLNCPERRTESELCRLGTVAEQLADRIVLTAREQTDMNAVRVGMGGWARPCSEIADHQNAAAAALELAGPGDVIVLAGQPDLRDFVCAYVENRAMRWKKKA